MTKLFASLILCFLLFSSQVLYAQNLVPNPSFEDTLYCPNSLGLMAVQAWQDCGTNDGNFYGTPDYFNECSNDTIPEGYRLVGVPDNVWGFQYAHSGNSYVGIITFVSSSPHLREIIGVELTTPMITGQKYYVSFWVSAAFGSYMRATCFSNKIGVRFSTTDYNYLSNPISADNYANIYTENIIDDTSDWTLISDSIVADQPYSFMMVGNFFDDYHIDTVVLDTTPSLLRAYYYVDDVCVSTEKNYCDFTNNADLPNISGVSISPNPADEFLAVQLQDGTISKLVIYNILGQMMYSANQLPQKIKIDVRLYPPGIYFMDLAIHGQGVIHKTIFIH